MERYAEPLEPGAVQRSLLLSVRPRFAHAILDGAKTVELRRTRVTAPVGTMLILYATSPVSSVIGIVELAGHTTGSPDLIWDLCGPSSGVTREEYEEYFAGASIATALHLKAPKTLKSGYKLAELRGFQPSFRPPQSFRYVTGGDPVVLHALAANSQIGLK